MKRILKVFLVLAGITLAAILALAIALPLFFDPNDYRNKIEEAVSTQTGREFRIQGPIEWSVFPWLGIELSEMSLANAPGFADQPLASIQSLAASVKLMPLLRENIEVGQVSLSGVELNLGLDESGNSNWQSILDRLESAEESAAPDAPATGLPNLVVSRVRIDGSAIAWSDAQAGQTATLKDFSVAADNIRVGEPFDLNMAFELSLADPGLSGETELVARIDSNSAATRFEFGDLSLEFSGELAGDPNTPVEVAVTGNGMLDTELGEGKLTDGRIQYFEAVVEGDFELTDLEDEPRVAGALEMPLFSPKALLTSMRVQLPETSDSTVLSAASASMKVDASAGDVKLTDVSIRLDDSTLEGVMGVGGGETATYTFDLRVDAIDLDRYLPSADSAADSGGEETAPLDVQTLRGIHADGRFQIGRLTVAGLSASGVDVRVTGDGEGVRLNPLTAEFYGGAYSGDLQIDASGDQPMLAMNEAVTGVQALPLLTDLQGEAPSLEGVGDIQFALTTDITTPESTLSSLNGNLNFSFQDGAVRGINVAQLIRQARASIEGRTLAVAEEVKKTDFSELRASARIASGVLENQDFILSSPLLRIVGDGRVDLVNNVIDYTIKPVLVTSLEGQGADQDLSDLSGIPVPVRLSGSLDAPSWKVDIAAALKESQKERIDEKKDELKQRLFDKVLGDDEEDAGPEELADGEEQKESSGDRRRALLRGLFGSEESEDAEDPDEGGDS